MYQYDEGPFPIFDSYKPISTWTSSLLWIFFFFLLKSLNVMVNILTIRQGCGWPHRETEPQTTATAVKLAKYELNKTRRQNAKPKQVSQKNSQESGLVFCNSYANVPPPQIELSQCKKLTRKSR